MNKQLLRHGFTLIEILVVVAIIGILSAVLFASFDDARQQAKNKALTSEMKEVQLALEVYKAQYDQYPPSVLFGNPCSSSVGGLDIANSQGCGINPVINGLVPDFIAEVPVHGDSGNSSCNIIYSVDNANFSFYKLTAANCIAGVSASDGILPDSEFARCPSNCGSCDGNVYNGTYEASSAFYESASVFSDGGQCI